MIYGCFFTLGMLLLRAFLFVGCLRIVALLSVPLGLVERIAFCLLIIFSRRIGDVGREGLAHDDLYGVCMQTLMPALTLNSDSWLIDVGALTHPSAK